MQKINNTIYTCTLANLPPASTMESGQRIWISDSGVMAYAGSVWSFDPLPARVWADILAIPVANLATGMLCRATDLSLHTFIWDGTNWQSSNGAMIKIGSSRTQVTISGSTSVDWQNVYTGITLPAGLVSVGGKLKLDYKIIFGTKSANGKGIRLRSGTATALSARLSASASNQGMQGTLQTMFDSVSSVLVGTDTSGTAEPFYTVGATASVNTAIAVPIYIDAVTYSSAESFTVYGYDLYVERRT